MHSHGHHPAFFMTCIPGRTGSQRRCKKSRRTLQESLALFVDMSEYFYTSRFFLATFFKRSGTSSLALWTLLKLFDGDILSQDLLQKLKQTRREPGCKLERRMQPCKCRHDACCISLCNKACQDWGIPYTVLMKFNKLRLTV